MLSFDRDRRPVMSSSTSEAVDAGHDQRESGEGPFLGIFPRFMDLPLELREAIWRHALPASRTINVLVYAFPGLKLAPLNRGELKLGLTQVCFEARRVVKESGYILAFRDEEDSDDPGVWFNPKTDVLDRTMWGPGDEDWAYQ